MIAEQTRIDMEKRLAELLGWTIEPFKGDRIWRCPDGTRFRLPPKWTIDWSACGPLMVEHGCWPQQHDGYITVRWDGPGQVSEPISAHPSKSYAVMYAVVRAAITKLEQA